MKAGSWPEALTARSTVKNIKQLSEAKKLRFKSVTIAFERRHIYKDKTNYECCAWNIVLIATVDQNLRVTESQ